MHSWIPIFIIIVCNTTIGEVWVKHHNIKGGQILEMIFAFYTFSLEKKDWGNATPRMKGILSKSSYVRSSNSLVGVHYNYERISRFTSNFDRLIFFVYVRLRLKICYIGPLLEHLSQKLKIHTCIFHINYSLSTTENRTSPKPFHVPTPQSEQI